MIKRLNCGQKEIDLTQPQVMGVLNVTPDSFSDGGKFIKPERAIQHAQKMVAAGAAIIDIGGESTRPGAAEVAVDDELRRVVPVIEALVGEIPVPVSVDTSKPEVMLAAVEAGASMVNDVRALREPGTLEAAVEINVPVCLMHMQGQPRTMQSNPQYNDVVSDIIHFLRQRIDAVLDAGISKENIVLDPGFGFGKTTAHNYTMLREFKRFTEMGFPLLAGLSRKSMIGAILDNPVEERMPASVALAVLVAERGANIIRVHDVKETVDGLKMLEAMQNLEN
ncbi:MAG TPA: dihydropteroate synthase [Chromatiales bacterium]|nr:dihydropteroate synthase [Thiotrichales bacterium]HIP68074.1 dihydropteroate synthase [Chromatiales bacterium]